MNELQAKIEVIEKKMDVYAEFYGWTSEEMQNLKDQLTQLNMALIDLMILEQELARIEAFVA